MTEKPWLPSLTTMLSLDLTKVLAGDIDYGRGSGFPVTTLPVSDLMAILHVCPGCDIFGFHVVGVQPTGLAIKLPFAKKPLATMGKTHYLICNRCGGLALAPGVLSKEAVAKLKQRIIPAEITDILDHYWSLLLGAIGVPYPYTKEFPEVVLNPPYDNWSGGEGEETGHTPEEIVARNRRSKSQLEAVLNHYTREKDPLMFRVVPGAAMKREEILAKVGAGELSVDEAARLLDHPRPTKPMPTVEQAPLLIPIVEADQHNPRLTLCPDCGRQVSRLATSCPQCGRPLDSQAETDEL